MKQINVFPLIYSRTKNVDFIPDFLARPEELDFNKANKYVGSAMRTININSSVRYSVFSVNEFMIFGIAGITKKIAEIVGRNELDIEYLKDKEGRSIKAFIGFAIKKSCLSEGLIPFASEKELWNIYITYLKKQWSDFVTHSERVINPDIDICTVALDDFIPEIISKSDKKFVDSKFFDENKVKTLNYYFNSIANDANVESSFLSGIEKMYEIDDCIFTDIATYNSIIDNYNHEISIVPTNNVITTITSQQMRGKTFVQNITQNGTESTVEPCLYMQETTENKKKTGCLPMCLMILTIILVLGIILII